MLLQAFSSILAHSPPCQQAGQIMRFSTQKYCKNQTITFIIHALMFFCLDALPISLALVKLLWHIYSLYKMQPKPVGYNARQTLNQCRLFFCSSSCHELLSVREVGPDADARVSDAVWCMIYSSNNRKALWLTWGNCENSPKHRWQSKNAA